MVRDRLLGVLCLGLAAAGATWGDGVSVGATGPGDPPGRGAHRDSAAPAPGAPGATTGGVTSTTAADSAPTTTTTGPGTATTTATMAVSPSAAGEPPEVLARRFLLGPEDLPGGFQILHPAPAGGAASDDGPFERCLGPEAGTLTAAVRAKARSAEYARAGTGTASSSSAVFDQPASAERVMAILDSPSARACFESLINSRLSRNPDLPEDVRGTLGPLALGAFGDQTTGFRFEVRLPAEEIEDNPSAEEIPYLADFVFVRRGRALALLEFANLRRPFPAADARAVAASVARRIPTG